LGKFDAKSDEGIFLGYSMNSKVYRVYNKRSLTIEESMHVVFDEVDSLKPKIVDDDDDDINVIKNNVNDIKMRDQASQVFNKEESMKNASHLELEQQFPKSLRIVKDHPIDQILGDPSQGINTRPSLRNMCNNTTKNTVNRRVSTVTVTVDTRPFGSVCLWPRGEMGRRNNWPRV